MKVCFLLSDLRCGGAERTIAYLSDWGVNNGYEIDVVLYGSHGDFYKLDSRVNIFRLNYDMQVKKNNILNKMIAYGKSKKIISEKFKEYFMYNKPDLVFCVLYHSLLYTSKIRKWVPIVGSERSTPKLKSKMTMVIRNSLYKKVEGMIYQTQRAEGYFKRILKCKSVVIPNAVGNELIQKVKYDDKKTINKISAVGSLKLEKDYETLIRAFEIFSKTHASYELEIYGSGQCESALKKLAEDLCVSSKVFFRGADLNALEKIANAKCYVLSSVAEGMPNALMEAMAIGMPCVATDCETGPAELIDNNKNGLLVPIRDVDQLSEAMSKMVDDREFALMCGKNASNIKETNKKELICKKYYDFFEKILKK